jgi:hypothetical protein
VQFEFIVEDYARIRQADRDSAQAKLMSAELLSLCGIDHRQANQRRAMIAHRLSGTMHDVGFRKLAKA